MTHDLLMKINERDKLYVEFNKTSIHIQLYNEKSRIKIKCRDVRKMTREAQSLNYNIR